MRGALAPSKSKSKFDCIRQWKPSWDSKQDSELFTLHVAGTVSILVVNSGIGAQVWRNLCFLISQHKAFDYIVRSQTPNFFFERLCFLLSCATWSELPSSIITMLNRAGEENSEKRHNKIACTTYPRSHAQFSEYTYYMKTDKTSWTYSICFIYKRLMI